MITTERIRSAADFAALQGEWNELLAASRSDCLFLTWEWLYAWWRHLREDRQLAVVTVRRDGRLIGIAPLALRPARMRRLVPFPVLEFLGSGNVGSDYLDVVVRAGEESHALAPLAESLTEHKLMVELAPVKQSGASALDLKSALARSGWIPSYRTAEVCPYIDLQGQSWDSYVAGLGRAHRHNFRRRLRNLSRLFDVRFEQVRIEAERGEAMRLLIALHHKRWHRRGGTNAFCTPALLAFHEELSRLALQRGWLRLYLLRLDGKAAAALYGFCYHGVFYFYQSGIDPAFAQHSVGMVMMGHAIRGAIEEGAQVYDFLRGGEAYKFLWTGARRELLRLELYPPSVRGRLYRRAMRLRGGIRTWLGAEAPAARANDAGPEDADGARHVA